MLYKFAPTLSPAEKKRQAEAKTALLIAERDKLQKVYGRVEFFIEPEAVDFYWNGQKHPESPTKHVQIQDLDVAEIYKAKFEVPKKPGDRSMMWYPKELVITPKDWKVVEGLNISRQNVQVDPTPENKEAIKKLAEEKKFAEDEAKKEERAAGKKKKRGEE